MTFKEILSRVRKVHHNAGETYVKALVNDALRELCKYNISLGTSTQNVVNEQRWYNIGDQNSDLKIDKIYSVAIMDDDGSYRKIPRLVDGNGLINVDRK